MGSLSSQGPAFLGSWPAWCQPSPRPSPPSPTCRSEAPVVVLGLHEEPGTVPHLQIPNLLLGAKSLFPCKATFSVSRDKDGSISGGRLSAYCRPLLGEKAGDKSSVNVTASPALPQVMDFRSDGAAQGTCSQEAPPCGNPPQGREGQATGTDGKDRRAPKGPTLPAQLLRAAWTAVWGQGCPLVPTCMPVCFPTFTLASWGTHTRVPTCADLGEPHTPHMHL